MEELQKGDYVLAYSHMTGWNLAGVVEGVGVSPLKNAAIYVDLKDGGGNLTVMRNFVHKITKEKYDSFASPNMPPPPPNGTEILPGVHIGDCATYKGLDTRWAGKVAVIIQKTETNSVIVQFLGALHRKRVGLSKLYSVEERVLPEGMRTISKKFADVGRAKTLIPLSPPLPPTLTKVNEEVSDSPWEIQLSLFV